MSNVVSFVLNDFTNDSRVYKVAESLSMHGMDVNVVALHNAGLPFHEVVGVISIDRIKLRTRAWPRVKLFQIFKYFEFVFRTSMRYSRSEYVHCNDLNALPIGVLMKIMKKNIKVIYDCHEYETEIDSLGFLEKATRKFMERLLIRFADRVITVSDSIANEYRDIYNIPKPDLVLNCPPYHKPERTNIFRERFSLRKDQNIFLYQGGLKSGRGIELLLEAFSGLEDDKNVLVVMGFGPLQALVEQVAQTNSTVFFHPAVKPDVLLNYTSAADYGILFYEDTCLNHRYCSPNKIFEYLMAGLPVLTSDLVEMRRLVEEEGVGVVAEGNSVEGFRKAVRASLELDYSSVKENVIKARKKFCWEEQEKTLLDVYGKL